MYADCSARSTYCRADTTSEQTRSSFTVSRPFHQRLVVLRLASPFSVAPSPFAVSMQQSSPWTMVSAHRTGAQVGSHSTFRVNSPFLDRIAAPNASCIVHGFRSLDLAHLPTLHLRWLGKLQDPFWDGGSRLQQHVRDPTEDNKRSHSPNKQRGTYVLRNGASWFVKYVIAFPSRPARPVRPDSDNQ